MASLVNRRVQPISMRLSEGDLALINQAASLRGHSRTEFVREAALRAAEETLLERRLFAMSAEGFQLFLAVLAEPARPVPEMQEFARRPAPWEPGYVRRE